jgi:hypothetical protein
MSGVFQNIDPPPPSPPGECVSPPPKVRGEDTLAGWKGGEGSIFWKTPDTALYSTYVSTLCSKLNKAAVCSCIGFVGQTTIQNCIHSLHTTIIKKRIL